VTTFPKLLPETRIYSVKEHGDTGLVKLPRQKKSLPMQFSQHEVAGTKYVTGISKPLIPFKDFTSSQNLKLLIKIGKVLAHKA